MTFAIWIIFALSVLLLYGAIRRETGFRLLKAKEKEGGGGEGITTQLDNLFAEKKDEDKKHFSKWVEGQRKKPDEDLEKERWFMYTITAVVGILVSVLVSMISDKPTGIAAAAIVILVMLHVIVWPFYTKKTSAISKVVITSIVVFYLTAWLIPGFADGTYAVWRITKKAGQDGSAAVVKIADSYEKGGMNAIFTAKPRITADGWEELDGGWKKTIITTSAEVDANGNPVAITPKVNGKPLDLRGKIYKFSCIEHGTLIVGETTRGEIVAVPCEELGINFGKELKHIGFAPKGTPTTVEFSYQTRI